MSARMSSSTLNEGRRLSPATRTSISGIRATGGWTLNEGRRLSPATSAIPVSAGETEYRVAQRRPEVIPGYEAPVARCVALLSNAQRRPEVIPGYEGRMDGQRGGARLRSTKAGGYPRLRAPCGRYHSETNIGSLNEGRRLSPATSRGARRPVRVHEGQRSTKAGGYPRLRDGSDEVIRARLVRRSTKAGGYPRLRGPLSTITEHANRTSLNEGRRLSPATRRLIRSLEGAR